MRVGKTRWFSAVIGARWLGPLAVLLLLVPLAVAATTPIRLYEFGDQDPGPPAIDDTILATLDSITPDPPGADEGFVPTLGGLGTPTYVAGKEEGLAAHFDGASSLAFTNSFRPHIFTNPRTNGVGFQLWAKPDPAGAGTPQVLVHNGSDLGEIRIGQNEQGRDVWGMSFPANGSVGTVTTNIPVTYDDWTNVGLLVTGNRTFLYVDGIVAGTGDGWFNGGDSLFTVGSNVDRSNEFYAGDIDDLQLFAWGGTWGSFDEVEDLFFWQGIEFSGVLGDVNDDGLVNEEDDIIRAAGYGFDNKLGAGDAVTRREYGDVDQNGRSDLFDFLVIRRESQAAGLAAGQLAAVPEPGSLLLLAIGGGLVLIGRAFRSRRIQTATLLAITVIALVTAPHMARADLAVGDDFLYNEPTSPVGSGAATLSVQYAGGANGPAGQWTDIWRNVGQVSINGLDQDPADQNILQVNSALSDNSASRLYALNPSLPASQTLYFSVLTRTTDTVPAVLNINFPVADETRPAISLGQLEGGGGQANLGDAQDAWEGFELADGDWHRLVGRLAIDQNSTQNEFLDVWIDPDPSAEPTTRGDLFVQADVISSITDLSGNLEMEIQAEADFGGQNVFWDDVTLATTYADAVGLEVPRMELLVSRVTGAVTMVNNTGEDFDLIAYEITSAAEELDPSVWQSLSGGDPNWAENNPDGSQLVETNFTSSATLADGESVNLGQVYTGSSEDLVFHTVTSSILRNVGIVSYNDDPGGGELLGDVNLDGVVNGLDVDPFVDVLLNGPYQTEADMNEDGDVNGLDVDPFVAAVVGGGAVQAVPEPTSVTLLVLGVLGIAGCRRWFH